jgi:homopolymeric O-antigen transport system ATP-binding protein
VTHPAVVATAVGKRYKTYDDRRSFVSRLKPGSRRDVLWAVRGVDLDVTPGETVGVIGRNGSGKTTLLRMLAGVTAPTEGRVEVHGRVAPLLSVGVGFHNELTGRENVFVNGVVLGLQRRVIEERFDEIIEFAGVEQFIDTPVKFYSSGMFVRLGFAVAVMVEPDVLLVDEVLAVGDAVFRAKCFARMQAMCNSGAAVVVVSHDLNAIESICNRAMVLDGGVVRYAGDVEGAISLYYDLVARSGREEEGRVAVQRFVSDLAAEVERYEVVDRDGNPVARIEPDDEIAVQMDVRFFREVVDPLFGVVITAGTGALVCAEANIDQPLGRFVAGDRARFEMRCRFPVARGAYHVQAALTHGDERTVLVRSPGTRTLHVSGRHQVRGVLDLKGRFSVAQPELEERT